MKQRFSESSKTLEIVSEKDGEDYSCSHTNKDK